MILFALALSPGVKAAEIISTVVVEDAPSDDAFLREVVTRLSAELRAAGFGVLPAAPARSQAGQSLDLNAAQRGSIAVFSIRRREEGAALEVTVADRVSEKLVSRRIAVAPRMSAAIVAVRAMELLRASLLELTPIGVPAAETIMPQDLKRWMKSPEPEAGEAVDHRRWSFALNLGVLDGLGSQSGPSAAVLGFSLMHTPHWAAGYAFELGLGFTPLPTKVHGALGSASLAQTLGVIEISRPIKLGSDHLLVAPVLGAGVFRLQANGEAISPAIARQADVWAAVGTAGVNWELKTAQSSGIVLALHALSLSPRVAVRVGGVTVVNSGWPLLLASTGFRMGWQ